MLCGLLASLGIVLGTTALRVVTAGGSVADLSYELCLGLSFVIVTGVFLYCLQRRSRRLLQAARNSFEQAGRVIEAGRRRFEGIARIEPWSWRPGVANNNWREGVSEHSASANSVFGVVPAALEVSNEEYIRRFIHQDDRLRVSDYFSDPRHGQPGFDLIDYRIVRPDGEVRTIHEATETVDGPLGPLWRGTIQDISKTQEIEASLARSEARFRDFAEIASHFQWELDQDLRILNFAGDASLLGMRNVQGIIGQTPWESAGTPDAASDEGWAEFRSLLLSRQPFHEFAYRARDPLGQIFHRRASGRPLFDDGGTFTGYRCVSRDESVAVREQQRAQAAEQRLSEAVESISDGFAIYDDKDRLAMMNSKYRESVDTRLIGDALGKTFEELIRSELAIGYYPEAVGREEDFIQGRLRAHRRSGDTLLLKNDAGQWTQARDQALPDGSIVAIRTDVTELVERGHALRRSQASLAAAQRIAKLGSWDIEVSDVDNINQSSLRWSDETFRIFGYEPGQVEVTNELFFQAVHPSDRAKISKAMEQALKEGIPYDIEHRIIRPDGREVIVRERADLMRDPEAPSFKMVGAIQDITEVKQTEEALRQSQKMEIVGQLTGGIAHDFNNLLMIVGGNLELLVEGLNSAQPRLRKFAQMAHDAVLRGAGLTHRLLSFSHRENSRPETTDLSSVVSDLVPLLHRTLGEHISVETVLAPSLWAISCDTGQLENAIVNLAVNARDAMPGGGQLTIRAENVGLDRAWVSDIADLQPGDYVMLAVSDNGAGMSPEIRNRVFEPFFTTKGVGKGTGLGLSMVYGFVKQSGGHIKMYSEVGHGTTVTLFLPKAQLSQGPDRKPVSEADIPQGKESVLLVEDDDAVRITVATMLRELGYQVLEAANGHLALAMVGSSQPFDLVLTDTIMPGGMTGWDLAQAIWRKQPETKVLLSTAYADNPIVLEASRDSRIRLLRKPYSKRILATTIRDIIDHSVGESAAED